MFRSNSSLALFTLVLLISAQSCSAAWKPGDTLPPLDSFKLEGKLPDNLKGHVVLIDFWASWCAPCRKSFPAMQELYKHFADQGVIIIAVNVDENRADMERFLKGMNISFTTVRDAQQKLVAAADVATMPTSFLIDRAGKIRFVHTGFLGDQTVKEYREQIQLLLKPSAP